MAGGAARGGRGTGHYLVLPAGVSLREYVMLWRRWSMPTVQEVRAQRRRLPESVLREGPAAVRAYLVAQAAALLVPPEEALVDLLPQRESGAALELGRRARAPLPCPPPVVITLCAPRPLSQRGGHRACCFRGGSRGEGGQFKRARRRLARGRLRRGDDGGRLIQMKGRVKRAARVRGGTEIRAVIGRFSRCVHTND